MLHPLYSAPSPTPRSIPTINCPCLRNISLHWTGRQLTSLLPPSTSPTIPFHHLFLSVQHVLAEDLKAADIEVGVVRDDGDRAFKVLSNEEVDTFLTALSERD